MALFRSCIFSIGPIKILRAVFLLKCCDVVLQDKKTDREMTKILAQLLK